MTQTGKAPLGKLIVVGAEQFGCQVLQTTKQLWKHVISFLSKRKKQELRKIC